MSSNGIDIYSRKNFVSSLIHFLTGKTVSGISNFLIIVLIVRNLPPEQYGIYTVLIGLSLFIDLISSFALNSAAFRFLPELIVSGAQKQFRKILSEIIIIRIISLFFFIVILYLFKDYLARY